MKSHMTPEELKEAFITLYGTMHGSNKRYAKDMGLSRVTVSRQVCGKSAISAPQAKLTRLLVKKAARIRRAEDLL